MCKFFEPLRIRTVNCHLSVVMYRFQPMRLSNSTIARQKISQSLHVVTSGSPLDNFIAVFPIPKKEFPV